MRHAARIQPRELARRLTEASGPRPVCLLPPEVHAAKRIPGALCACIYEVAFPETMARLVPDLSTPLALYGADAHSREADVAAHRLASLGYADVVVLAGGIAAWECAGLPLEGDAPRAPLPDPATQPPAPGRYVLVPQECSLEWTGRNKTGRHTGSVAVAGGGIELRQDGLRGEVRIDVASIRDHDLADAGLNALLVAHLLSEDFFAAARFPAATMVLDDATPIPGATPGMPTHHVHGRLTLRGLTRPLCFPVTLARLPDERLAAEAHFDLDRTLWGADYGCGRLYRCLDYHLVYDHVGIALRLVAEPEN